MAFPFPPSIDQPIPNNPFYYPESNFVSGDTGSLIVGAGLTVNNLTGEITLSGFPGNSVTTITAGPGIYTSAPNGNITLANTGVISITAGPGISITGTAGNYTITNTAPASAPTGTVTQVNAGIGLIGGPITSSGTLSLSNTGVAPGIYNNANITVDAQGRITAATNGLAPSSGILATAPLSVSVGFPQTISVSNASTATCGVVRLEDSVSCNSTVLAATANAVRVTHNLASTASSTAATALTNSTLAQSCANVRIPCSCFTASGTLLAGTGPATFTALSTGAPGSALVTDNTCVGGMKWVPGATGTFVSQDGKTVTVTNGIITSIV